MIKLGLLILGLVGCIICRYHDFFSFRRKQSTINSAIPMSNAITSTPIDVSESENATLSQTKKWCHHMKHSKPPHILLYNRLPKSGSSSMQYKFQQLSKLNKVLTWSTTDDYWIDFSHPNKSIMRSRFVGNISSLRARYPFKQIVVDGHWNQISINEFDGEVEYFQLIRDCHSRRKSDYFFTLFDSVRATKAKREKKYLDEVLQLLNLDAMNRFIRRVPPKDIIFECTQDYNCLRKSKLITYSADVELRSMCGYECQRMHSYSSNPILQGSISNMRNISSFSIVGILEYFPQFLELLECMYPNFQNITRITNEKKKTSEKYNSFVIDKLLNETCNASTNRYTQFYEEAKKTFLSRYNYAMEHSDECCRNKMFTRSTLF